MEAVLSTAQIAELTGDTREWMWELARRGEIDAERANPDGKQYRYKDSISLRNWCANRRFKRKAWAWTAEQEKVLNRKRPRLDSVGKEMWRKLGKRNHLTADELRESIQKGTVTKIKSRADRVADKANRMSPITTWRGLLRLYDFHMRKIGDSWEQWTEDGKAITRQEIKPIAKFYRSLGGKWDDLV
jgi:hypothetical protein